MKGSRLVSRLLQQSRQNSLVVWTIRAMKKIEKRKDIRELFKILKLTGLGDGVAMAGGWRV